GRAPGDGRRDRVGVGVLRLDPRALVRMEDLRRALNAPLRVNALARVVGDDDVFRRVALSHDSSLTARVLDSSARALSGARASEASTPRARAASREAHRIGRLGSSARAACSRSVEVTRKRTSKCACAGSLLWAGIAWTSTSRTRCPRGVPKR